VAASSQSITKRSSLLWWFGLALLAGFVVLHMVACLPGLHDPASGTGGHVLSASRAGQLAAISGCRFDLVSARGLAVMHDDSDHHEEDHHHHASCADAGALGWLDGIARSPLDLMLAVAAAALLLMWCGTCREVAPGCRGSPPADELPLGHWIRHRLRGAMLPAALCVSRT
jgi:hypothetical protein